MLAQAPVRSTLDNDRVATGSFGQFGRDRGAGGLSQDEGAIEVARSRHAAQRPCLPPLRGGSQRPPKPGV